MSFRPWKLLLLARAPQLLLYSLPLVLTSPVQSVPELVDLTNATFVDRRSFCDGTKCGYYGQVCCGWSEGCFTNANDEATCTPAPTAAPTITGYWIYSTSTWVETDRVTRTSIYSSYISPASTPVYVPPPKTTEKPASCPYGQQSCGPICCKSWQYCKVSGECASGNSGTLTAPLRPTSVATIGHTKVIPQTTTVGFQPAVETGMHHGGGGVTISESSGGGGLSSGAIAGIVIGVIAAIIILILLCLILCFGAAWNAVLAFFGLRKRRRRTVEVEEYRRHGSRADDRQWYGSSRPSRPPPPKKKKDSWGWGTVILGLGALWAALGFKRRRDRRRDEKSSYTGSSGYYSYDSNSSSDRRTRDTRRSSRR